MKKKIGFSFLIPIVVAGIFAAFNQFNFYQVAENGTYDLLLHIKPAVPEDESILLIDIDDLAIARVGVFPWSRDIMADGLILMKEFEAGYAVFDIEYTEQSPRGVNNSVLTEEIPELFAGEFSAIDRNVNDLFLALKTGTISMRDAEEYVQDLSGLTEASKNILLKKVADIARDNDKYLGQAARLFEKAYFTVSMLLDEDETSSGELKAYVNEKVSIKNIDVQAEIPFIVPDIRPAILPIIRGGRGAGFPNVVVDEGGVRRRITLIMKHEDKYFPQLAFSPLLDWLGNPQVIVGKGKIVLKNAQLPGKQVKDITIPLTEDERILINWPKKTFIDSFRHMTYYELVLHQRLEANLVHNLKIMEDSGYLSYYKGDSGLLDPYRYAESIKKEVLEGGDPASMADYREARTLFFAEVGKFIQGEAEKDILGDIEAILSSDEVTEETRAAYREIEKTVPEVFSATREIYRSLAESRTVLKENLPGSFCIIGQTGTSTTDIGVNPFVKEYMNVGTHASLANTILSGLFLDDLPWWYSAVLALAISLVITVIIRGLNPLPSILVGVGFLILLVLAGAGFFLYTGIYLNLLTPSLSVFFTFIVLTIFKFLILEKEKSFLRNAFSHYLSTDVISELITDPEKLNLGGEKKRLTAIFTDVRGFSTISEKLDPTDLVKLLNAYLTGMSDIILELKGTIDKYEGDAIISFFGAPVVFEDHARRACLSAVRMKKMERQLNEHFLKENLSPAPLYTRFGINTGEMVVGNMGTAQKMDYTIMGNSVNLAARLEGVNKQYGTWILISEDTCLEGGADFTLRQMDRVRVVGIEKPVRLYELIDEKQSTPPDIKEAVEIFHRGQELFEQKEWAKARGVFKEVLKIIPDDGPSEVFLKRCNEYLEKPPPESWDGVFNLAVK